MNEKSLSTKLLLTIPALFIGILSVIMHILKPTIELWFPEKEEPELPELPPVEKHEFH